MIKIFIGYDPREAIAYHVCSNSIIRHATRPVSITPLALNNFKDYKETHMDGSNQFIYSRFLTPALSDFMGWTLFIDGDMILREDIVKLWELRDDSKAVMVVKHDYKTKMNEKYLGSKNEDYPRKNWSSVIMWNCSHPKNRTLTPSFVEQATGAQLHRFSWLSDDDIGELPKEWNWLDVEYDHNPNAKLVHYTLGTPCFHEFADQGNFANEWHRERVLTEHCQQHDLPK
jgi:lipopolysaccharide biosynthesis glycosyltransferase